MASTTNAKKEVIDFLWEWAEINGEWAKLLLDNILTSSSCLTQQERITIFQYFLQSLKLHSGLPSINIVKPIYTNSNKSIKISTLSEVTGVNRLAKNQTINFSENVTVVYGENGTGKTGYSRILKALGFSYETSGTIHPNVYNPSVELKSAKIDFEANGIKKSFLWTGANRSIDLDSISVFNNHCVAISLSDRQLVVTPIGFELFNLVTDELNALTLLLTSEKQKYKTTIDWISILTPNTPQYTYISKLSKSSLITDLKTISNFDEECKNRLAAKVTELNALNKALIEATLRELRLKAAEINNVLSKIKKTESVINHSSWENLHTWKEDIKQLENQSQKGLKEIVESYNIEFYTSTEFLSFITSAENYIKILSKVDYPQEEDTCIFCKQTLDNESKNLIANYRTLLNDTAQAKLNELKGKINHFKAEVIYLDANIKLSQAIWGYDAEGNILQTVELQNYNIELNKLKDLIVTDKTQVPDFIIDYVHYIQLLDDKKLDITELITKHHNDLNDIAAKEAELIAEINELKDRKTLFSKYSEIIQTIENHKISSTLNNSSSFNTRSISLKTTEAREELIRQNFNSIFKTELAAFRKSHLNIDLNFATDRGNSKVQQRVKSHILTEILSEGEQKAIALSEFLTELQLDNVSSTVIFDDPVNSLDHHLIDDFSRRIITLSKSRQVIIFTHSILLFNSLLYFKSLPVHKELFFVFYNSKNEHETTGVIDSADEINTVKTYIGKINVLINGPKNRPEVEMAEDGYGYLRSAIELCVEHEIFNGTVKRYQKNVALTQFIKVDGQLLDANKEKLNEIFERCCGYIKGHSNPMEIHNDPSLTDLNRDFTEFKTIRSLFSP
ncbi:AAA family ATPase [Mucilaginibacter sp.]|uniref:AAA family ATPase n=1 Tax=Mucilaginibacter sp. TaxID=1882438 RepID=UPI002612BF3F|nr:AAA family ATPase [Mucilaginibacter sp.]MDB4925838.1 hypothetical protein [Mucilaginibacter sp.]